jgi:citrate synthase
MDVNDKYQRHVSAVRLIAKMPTLAAFAYRRSLGLPYVYPDNDLTYTGNFLSMLFKMAEPSYAPDPRIERALDVLFILHADHEQNCSAAAVRVVGSSLPDPFSAVAAGCAGLYGPLHGGANVAVLKMLQRIGSPDNIPDFLQGVKDGNERLMGFGHRVYKNYDPRARIIRGHVDEVLEATSKESPLLDVAIELEKRALDDEYFTSRKLYPNVDYWSGIIYEAMNIPPDAFTVMFAIGRTPGWMAQWLELMNDEEFKIARPRQIYTGAREADYVPLNERDGSDS